MRPAVLCAAVVCACSSLACRSATATARKADVRIPSCEAATTELDATLCVAASIEASRVGQPRVALGLMDKSILLDSHVAEWYFRRGRLHSEAYDDGHGPQLERAVAVQDLSVAIELSKSDRRTSAAWLFLAYYELWGLTKASETERAVDAARAFLARVPPNSPLIPDVESWLRARPERSGAAH